MVLLLEAVLADAVGGVGEGVFVELLEADLFLVGALEGGDAVVSGCEGGLELGDGGLGEFLDGFGIRISRRSNDVVGTSLQSQSVSMNGTHTLRISIEQW